MLSQGTVWRSLGSWWGYHGYQASQAPEGMWRDSLALLSGKASGTQSPKKLTPKSNTSFCISLHQLMGNRSLRVKGKKIALMLLRLMCCNMGRAMVAQPRAMRATEHLILIVTALLKGKAEFSTGEKKKCKGFFIVLVKLASMSPKLQLPYCNILKIPGISGWENKVWKAMVGEGCDDLEDG